MKATIAIEDPDEVEVTLTITMRAKEWKRLREQLAHDYPSWALGSLIRNSVNKVEQVFEVREEKEP